jgi:hypothetical protein
LEISGRDGGAAVLRLEEAGGGAQRCGGPLSNAPVTEKVRTSAANRDLSVLIFDNKKSRNSMAEWPFKIVSSVGIRWLFDSRVTQSVVVERWNSLRKVSATE